MIGISVSIGSMLTELRKHAFTIVVGVASAAIVGSCALAYQALHHQPEMSGRNPKAMGALLASHGLMLGVVGLLYLARQAERKLRLDADRRSQEADERFAGLQQLQRRRQRLESLGTLSSGIAHDLNNLLTPILMSSRMLQRNTPNVDREALIETIASGASRGADLISQLLTFARGGKGQHEVVEVAELLSETIMILQRTLPENISLNTGIDADLPPIFGDATEISQVVMNLAINARDAMVNAGNVTGELGIAVSRMRLTNERSYSFATLQPGEYLAIAVSDTGTGIPPAVRDKMFDPFFTTKERGQGTGLGLSTSIGIVRSHQGAVDVQSEVGAGTTVTVIFPVLQTDKPNERP